jgi:hypothetical protein
MVSEETGSARLCNAARRKKGKPNGEIISEQFLSCFGNFFSSRAFFLLTDI